MADARTFVSRVLIFLGLVALALFLWRIQYALLLTFGGVLFAVFLHGAAAAIQRWTGLGRGWSLAVVAVALLALVAVAAFLVGPAIAGQLGELTDALGRGVERVRGYLEEAPWGKQLRDILSEGMQQGGGSVLRLVSGALTGVLDILLAVVLILFAGIYFAASPKAYTEGLVWLFPPSRHGRAREVLATAGNALWLWLLGQLAIMAAVGVLTALGLMLIGVPLAIALGVIAALLEFIPFLGPFLAAVPVLLVALTVDTSTALYALLLFVVIQQLEGNVLEPLVQRKAVSLPPVLVLVATIAFALLFGILGAVLATPLLVVVVVLVKMLYMEDALGERPAVPGDARS
jgi:predicted PurR-regulated permease PerM